MPVVPSELKETKAVLAKMDNQVLRDLKVIKEYKEEWEESGTLVVTVHQDLLEPKETLVYPGHGETQDDLVRNILRILLLYFISNRIPKCNEK